MLAVVQVPLVDHDPLEFVVPSCPDWDEFWKTVTGAFGAPLTVIV
jgi:hypothetical protein